MESVCTVNSPILSDADIEFVSDLARQAGKLAVQMREGVSIREKSGPFDRVTDADIAVSTLIVDALRERFPNDLIISEEEPLPAGAHAEAASTNKRVWFIDPIDGTDNYINRERGWSVMIGLTENLVAGYGWVYAGAKEILFRGGRDRGCYRIEDSGRVHRYQTPQALTANCEKRVMTSYRDKRNNSWILAIPQVQWVPSGSVGLKIVKVLEDSADMFLSLAGRFKYWDTAAPTALAYGAGLEVGSLEDKEIEFEIPACQHKTSLIIGRPGTLEWCRTELPARMQAQTAAKRAEP